MNKRHKGGYLLSRLLNRRSRTVATGSVAHAENSNLPILRHRSQNRSAACTRLGRSTLPPVWHRGPESCTGRESPGIQHRPPHFGLANTDLGIMFNMLPNRFKPFIRAVAAVVLLATILTGCYIDNGVVASPPLYIQTTISSSCPECRKEADLTILWERSNEAEGYVIYYGPEPDNATRMIGGGPTENIFTVPLTVSAGEQVCFRITAYMDYAESDYSPAVCIDELFPDA